MKICAKCGIRNCTELKRIKCAMSEIQYNYMDFKQLKGYIRDFSEEENRLIHAVILSVREDLEELFSDCKEK